MILPISANVLLRYSRAAGAEHSIETTHYFDRHRAFFRSGYASGEYYMTE